MRADRIPTADLGYAPRFPATDAATLRRYVDGDEADPKGAFRLSDDRWDVGAYALEGRWQADSRYHVNFEVLRSFLRPYAKWYVYERLILARGFVSTRAPGLVYVLGAADRWLMEHDVRGLDELAAPDTFSALWESLLEPIEPGRPRSPSSVQRQLRTSVFWRALREEFGAPTVLPPVASYHREWPVDIALDDDRVLPAPVTSQIFNRLALHREDVKPLDRYDLLRACVLSLHIVLGRRIAEVLATSRGQGRDGPLVTYPTTDGETALGFRFHPVKGGPDDVVYISPAWADIARYCVTTLLRLGDEVRRLAAPEDRHRLILVAGANFTRGGPSRKTAASAVDGRILMSSRPRGEPARALSYDSFQTWLNGKDGGRAVVGVMTKWRVTEDGTTTGPIFWFRTHEARHARQTALMADPTVSRLAGKRDLNHRSNEMQVAYQHGLREQNERLIAKAQNGELTGAGSDWVRDVLGVAQGREAGTPGLVADNPRFAALVAANPMFVNFTRVPMGYCTLPQGPAACPEMLLCVEATETGCSWFTTDPSDPTLRSELDERAAARRADADDAAAGGRVVLSGKLAVLAERAERMRDGAAAMERLKRAQKSLGGQQ